MFNDSIKNKINDGNIYMKINLFIWGNIYSKFIWKINWLLLEKISGIV